MGPVWRVVSGFIKEPTEAQKRCHYPKPILLDVGEISSPYLWTPNIVDVQVLRVGQLVIIVSPGEATTMAGRRWKEAIHSSASSLALSGSPSVDPVVVIGGPANSYTHYISTTEEYGIQRYEGPSTLYGPYTLNAYINRSLSFITGVVFDDTPIFKHFGDVKTDTRPAYSIGDIVSVTFVGANPRNSLRLEETYAAIELFDTPTSRWVRVRDDSDWALIFNWKRTSGVLGTSEVEIVWETEEWAVPGRYRVKYYGDSKAVGGKIMAFEGVSGEFILA